MDRNPCGPPSQRHHISGAECRVRSEDRYSGVREPWTGGCRAGRSHGPDGPPARARAEHAARVRRHRRPPGQRAEERRRRATAAPATGCARGRRAGPRGPRRSRPGGAAAAARRPARPCRRPSRHSSRQQSSLTGEPGGGRLQCREDAQLEDEAVVVRGQLAVDARRERVVAQRLLQQRGGLAPPPGALGEPRERAATPRAARRPRRSGGCWPTTRGSRTSPGTAGASESGAAPGRCARTGPPRPASSSSSRRIQAKLISRTPSSMPLVQLTPDRNGLAAHQDRSWASTRSA